MVFHQPPKNAREVLDPTLFPLELNQVLCNIFPCRTKRKYPLITIFTSVQLLPFGFAKLYRYSYDKLVYIFCWDDRIVIYFKYICINLSTFNYLCMLVYIINHWNNSMFFINIDPFHT